MTFRTLPEAELLYRHDAEVGEGPVWDPRIGKLIWVDIPNKTLFTTDVANGSTVSRTLPEAVGVVLPRAAGGYVAALEDGFYVIPDRGAPELIARVEADNPRTRFNDGEIDRQGRLWAGTMAWDGGPDQGALYRLDLDGSVTQMLDGISISNGLAWSPDDTTMYYVDTPTQGIDQFDFDPVNGQISNRRVFTTITHGDGRPDGLTVDTDGAIWVATWPGYGVHRYLPDGSLDAIVPLPVSNVSSCEFGGADLRDLFITTAWGLLTDTQRVAQPMAGSLFHIRVPQQGIARVPFAG